MMNWLKCLFGFHLPQWHVKLNYSHKKRKVYGYETFLHCSRCEKKLSEVTAPTIPISSRVNYRGDRPNIGLDVCTCGAYTSARCDGFCYANSPQPLKIQAK